MSSGRSTFLIQRYGSGIHPQISGVVPFIVRGPNISGRHVLRRVLTSYDFTGFEPDEIRLMVAEFMLREGFCQAAWTVEMPSCCPMESRWDTAVRACADEIPKVCDQWPISLGAWELLDGMSSVEHYRHLLIYDEVLLESMEIPPFNLTP